MSAWKMDDQTGAASHEEAPVAPGEIPRFERYDAPAGGWGALQVTAKALRENRALFSKVQKPFKSARELAARKAA
jgi:hypothetical protein